MKIVIVAATAKEIDSIKDNISSLYEIGTNKLQLSFHVTGVGMLPACFHIAQIIYSLKPDLIIQAGIAGAFNSAMPLGEVVFVKEELIGDIGVEEDGTFTDVFDMGLQDPNNFPFTDKLLINPWLTQYNLLKLEEVTGLTANKISTGEERIEQLKNKYSPISESMEGAALHYVCLQLKVPFIQIRAMSNYVGERDKEKWKFTEAFTNLGVAVLRLVEGLNNR